MNRWGMRVLGIIMLLIFGLIFLQLYKQLVDLQQRTQNRPAATQTLRSGAGCRPDGSRSSQS